MDDLTEAGYIAGLSSLVGALIGLGLEVALLAIALGPVRRHRPEVSGLFVTAAILGAITIIAWPVVSVATSFLSGRSGGPGAVVRMNALVGILLALVRAGSVSLVLAGIARLATPARRDPREPD